MQQGAPCSWECDLVTVASSRLRKWDFERVGGGGLHHWCLPTPTRLVGAQLCLHLGLARSDLFTFLFILRTPALSPVFLPPPHPLPCSHPTALLSLSPRGL